MKKQISPAFAAIVIIVALLLGTLYFLVQYRDSEARVAAEKAAMQRQAEQMRATRGMRRGTRVELPRPSPDASQMQAPAGDEDQKAAAEDE